MHITQVDITKIEDLYCRRNEGRTDIAISHRPFKSGEVLLYFIKFTVFITYETNPSLYEVYFFNVWNQSFIL